MNVRLDPPAPGIRVKFTHRLQRGGCAEITMRDVSPEMKKLTGDKCPHCGANVPSDAQPLPRPFAKPASAEDREYDHRGILLPRRARVGGIIIPQ
jgi:hypothetical protein